MNRLALLLLTAVMTLLPGTAAPPPPGEQQTQPKSRSEILDARKAANPVMYDLAELARGTAPEFAAWGLLRILDSGRIQDPAWRWELAEEALELGQKASEPVSRRFAPGLPLTHGTALRISRLHSHGLDRLSLTMRAIRHLQKLHGNAAREAFLRVPRPRSRAVTCKDALIDNASTWYETAAVLGLPEDTLAGMLSGIQSYVEVGPAIQLLQRSGASEQLTTALASGLRSVAGSEREFTATLAEVNSLLPPIARTHPDLINPAWRAWLAAGLALPACAESSRVGGWQETARQNAVALFNSTAPQSIPVEAAKPSSAGGDAADFGVRTYTDDEMQRKGLFEKLTIAPGGVAITPEQHDTPEWRDNFDKLLQSIQDIKAASGESNSDFFFRKLGAYMGAMMMKGDGAKGFDEVLRVLLAESGSVEPLIWFEEMEQMAEHARVLNHGNLEIGLQAMEQTGHPVMQLYARLERILPSPPAIRAFSAAP